ncbi:MAG: NADH-quinone oxidoreductase subunit L [Endomicrobiales bacterium]|nr:NADH-quinone oxidoreductase subunit L [Endomicrobiales bacterium]
MNGLLQFFIITPSLLAAAAFLSPKRIKGLREGIALVATGLNLYFALAYFGRDIYATVPWGGGLGLDFSLRLYGFSSFIIASAAAFSFLITLYSSVFMYKKEHPGQFYLYLILSVAMINGAVLADNLVVLLFFWEGLLVTLFGMIFIGHKGAYKTAMKALIIAGITDLCMMLGIALTYYLAGTLTISKIHLPMSFGASVAFIFIMIGAISKAGSMPFHSWIPDAAVDAPLPFMAFLPGSLEKLIGIYFLTRISLDMFQLSAGSWVSTVMMIVGAVTIILAVMMALVQKDFKKLLSYHAISQVGYMILGIGTAVPVGIVGGIFHMLNNAIYKSCLFLTGGAVEHRAGTTDLRKLGGLGKVMPVTFASFIVAALAISGVPPFNGFFSKELVYDGALERHWIFYFAAVAGSFFTAASFLKLGHSAFGGKISEEFKKIKEAPFAMLVPMVVIASACIVFGLYNSFPIDKLIAPVLGEHAQSHVFSGFPHNIMLVAITLVVLAGAVLNHIYGVKKTGKGLGAVDHIHHAPVLSTLYDKSGQADPYDIGMKLTGILAAGLWYIDRGIDWLYNGFSVYSAYAIAFVSKNIRGASYSAFIIWSLIGAAAVLAMMFGKS